MNAYPRRPAPKGVQTGSIVRWIGIGLTVFVCGAGAAAEGLTAPADFYPFAQRWAKSRAESSASQESSNSVFQTAVRPSASATVDPLGLPPPSIKRALSGIAATGESIALEETQMLLLASDTPIAKYASTEEFVVELSTEGSMLVVVAKQIGKTVLHVWDDAGRKTFEVRVVPRKISGPTYLDLRRDEIQKTRPFKVRLTADTETYETGAKFQELSRTSLDVREGLTVEGDTPYGYLHSHAQVQRSGISTKNVLTDAQVALLDGRVGPLRNFNAAAGDSQVKPDFLVFSRGRVRGVAGDTWTDDKRFNLSGFFGREQQGIFAPLSPSATSSKRSIDSFLSGTTAAYRVSDDLKMRAGYFTGYGRARPDDLNRQGMALSAQADFGPHLTLLPEIDYDSEHLTHLHVARLQNETTEVRAEFRNINESFQSMIGAPSQQGELGGRLDATVRPWERWRWRGLLDVFKDRRIPNPDSPDERNLHVESEIVYDVADRSTLSFIWRGWDDTGRVSPSRERSFGLQYTESFEAFGRTIAVNLRGAHRRSRFLSQPLSNYDRSEFSTGLFFPLFWDIRFSIQKEWSWLDDVNLEGRWSQPEALTYSLSTSRRLWQSPFYFDVDFRYRDEEETESPNSFMTGEDSTELSGGLYYRESEDLEIYLKGQFQNFNAESARLSGHRVEGQVLAGMRWDWDTGVRWGGVGSVRGSVFKDENANGRRDPGESGLAGLAIETLSGAKALSDEEGRFEIKGISDRTASLTVDTARVPAGYVPTGSMVRDVQIAPGQTVEVEFGFAPRSEAAGTVFNDLNGNGLREASEPGVARVRLKTGGKSAMTVASGAYVFGALDPGSHTLELDLLSVPEGYLPSGPVKKSFELEEGMRYPWDVPLKAYRVVSGRVFRDRDANAAWSLPEDEPVAGALVRLGVLSQKTDGEGRFLFDQLAPGSYELLLDPSVLSAEEKSPAAIRIELGPGPQTETGQDLGIVSETGRKLPYQTTGPASPELKEPSA